MKDFPELLRALNNENVKFVIIGGFAMMLHGTSTVTFALDMAIALDNANGEAFIKAFAPFRPFPSQFGSADNFVWDSRSLVGTGHVL